MKNRGVIRTLGVIAVAMFCVAFVTYLSLQPAVPRPQEARRIKHPNGFSAIAPADWVHTVGFRSRKSPDELTMTPAKTEGFPLYFVVRKLDEAHPDTFFTNSKHQPYRIGRYDGWRKETDRNTRYSLQLQFERDGQWFFVGIVSPKDESLDSTWSEYIDAVRVER